MGMEERPTRLLFGLGRRNSFSTSSLRKSAKCIFRPRRNIFRSRCAPRAKMDNLSSFQAILTGFSSTRSACTAPQVEPVTQHNMATQASDVCTQQPCTRTWQEAYRRKLRQRGPSFSRTDSLDCTRAGSGSTQTRTTAKEWRAGRRAGPCSPVSAPIAVRAAAAAHAHAPAAAPVASPIAQPLLPPLLP